MTVRSQYRIKVEIKIILLMEKGDISAISNQLYQIDVLLKYLFVQNNKNAPVFKDTTIYIFKYKYIAHITPVLCTGTHN